MVQAPANVVTGVLKPLGPLDALCYTDLAQFLSALPALFGVEIPADSLSGVIISTQQPAQSDINKLWIRRSGSGSILGGFVYSQGKWVQLFPTPSGLEWIIGDSRTPPAGYIVVDEDNPLTLTPSELDKLQQQYIRDPSDTYWKVYAAVFVGV